MRHYKARQRKDGQWDYTVNLGDFIIPVGYCSKYHRWTEEDARRFDIPTDHPTVVRGEKFAHKHHDCGHSTPEEARECYRQYLLDQELRLMCIDGNAQRKCMKCGDWTQHYAEVDMKCFQLCEAHNSRECVSEYLTVGESWQS